MDIASGFKKVKKYIKESSGYRLLSHWTSSRTVEMDDGTTLEERISNVDNTADTDKPVSRVQQKALDKKADLASPTLTGTPKAPTASAGTNTTQIATTAFVQTAVSDGIAASDALVFKGTLGTDGTAARLPAAYKTGWTYRVVTPGTHAGQVCETGDLIIALADRDGSGNTDSDWCVAQTNIDGAITGIKSGDAFIGYSQSGSIVTITHKDVARTDTSSTASPNAGDAITIVNSVTSDEKGHITGVDTQTVTLPSTAKIDTNAGAANTPVYFSNGKPVSCSYEINKTVPSNAVFTDTTNTAGSTTTTAKRYLIGTSSTGSSGAVTYANNNCYMSGGYLYSNGEKIDISSINDNLTNQMFKEIPLGKMPGIMGTFSATKLPSGYDFTNTFIVALRIARALPNENYIYSNDGNMCNVYLQDSINSIVLVPTQDGITYCAGSDVSALLARV